MTGLIVSDLDNTMVPEGTFDLNPEYIDVINALLDKGYGFVAASGRHYNSMAGLLEKISGRIIFLCGNGTYVAYRGRTLFYKELDRECYLEALDYFDSMGGELVVTDTADFSWTDCRDPEKIEKILSGYRLKVNRIESLRDVPGPVLKTAMYSRTDAQAPAAFLREKFAGKANVMAAGARWVDIIPHGADKAAALKVIQKELGVTAEETIAFGDNENDLGMLSLAGKSYAVGNARETVKKAAGHVIGDVSEDSVLKELKKLL